MSTPAWARGRRFCVIATGSKLEQKMKSKGLDFVVFDPKHTEDDFKKFVAKKKCNVFIFEAFKGQLYDAAMEKNYMILSMNAALRLVEMDNQFALPSYTPLLSLAMAGVSASCTNVSPEQRSSLHTLVQQMGGEVKGDLTVAATHLIAGTEPGWHKTIKYKAALEMNVAVVTPDWVHDAFQKSKSDTFSATAPDFLEKHRLKMFRDCVICVTQLSEDQRALIRSTMPQHGGIFQPHLSKDCTHLIAASPEGQKYTAALSLPGTFIIRPSWFDECLRINGRAEESPFTFTATNSEAAATLTPSESSLELGDQCFFLDGVRVFLYGFAGTRQTHMIKLVRLTGAVLVSGDASRTTSTVNYIVCAFQPEPKQLDEWRALAQVPIIVHPAWLVESYRQQTFLSPEPFEVVSASPLAPPQQNAAPSRKQPPPAAVASAAGTSRPEGDFFESDWNLLDRKNPAAGGLKLFTGLSIAVAGHTPAARTRIREILEKQGARLEDTPAAADLTIVPLMQSGADLPPGPVATQFWIETCVLEARLISPTSRLFFQPCERWQKKSSHTWPLKHVGTACVCLSGFDDIEKLQLHNVMQSLGFRMSDELRRRDCTHLVCAAPAGKKYETAKHWRLPVVSIDWVFQSAIADELLPADKFQILTPLSPLRDFSREADLAPREQHNSEKSFHPAFDVGDALSMLRTPNQSFAHSTTSSLEAMLSRNIKDAAVRTGTSGPGGYLDDVIVFVSKTATLLKRETLAEARQFGLRVVQSLDIAFTHLVAQGRLNDASRELRAAKQHHALIVSPHWLTESLRCNMRAPEKLFPSTYDPSRTLPDMSALASTGARTDVALGTDDEDDDQAIPPMASLKALATTTTTTTAAPGHAMGVNVGHPPSTVTGAGQPVLMTATSLAVSAAASASATDPSPAATGFAVPSRRPVPASPATPAAPTTPQTVPPTPAARAAGARAPGDDDIDTKIAAILKASENIASNRTRRAQRNATPVSEGRASSGSNATMKRISEIDHDPEESLTQPAIGYDDPCALKRQKFLARVMAKELPDETPEPAAAAPAAPAVPAPPAPVAEDRRLVSVRDEETNGQTASCDMPTATATASGRGTRRRHVFLLSSMSAEDKQRLSKIINKLGGEVFDTAFFVPECTHVIVSAPSRNEKYLAACAAGKWVLKPAYITASEKAGRFVGEEPYEWVGAREQTPGTRDLAVAPRRWRLILQDGHLTEVGAFAEWRVLLAVSKALLPAFRRLLEAGGCRSIRDSPPYDPDSATHALIDEKSPHAAQMLSSVRTLPCLRVEYISEYLLSSVQPDLAAFTVRPQLSGLPGDEQTAKRARVD